MSSGAITLGTLNVGTLSATGTSISEDLSANVTVTNRATLTTAGDIGLTTGTNRFGSLSLTGSDVTVNEIGGTQLDFVQAKSLDVVSDGIVEDGLNAEITVDNDLTILALGDVTFGDQLGESIEFGVINITGDNITIVESDDSSLGFITGESFDLQTAGNISQVSTSILDIKSDVILNANSGNSNITLSQNNNAFGSISLRALDANIVENLGDNGTALGTVEVESLDLASSGAVTGSAIIKVSDEISIVAGEGLESVTLDNVDNRLNRVSVAGTDAKITNSQDTVLLKLDVGTFNLTIIGDVTDSPDDELNVAGLAVIDAGSEGSIILGTNINDTAQFGSVQFSGDQIDISQPDDVTIAGINAQSKLNITSTGGNIESIAESSISAGLATTLTVDRSDGNIDLQASNNVFGELSIVGRDVFVSEADDIIIGNIDVDSLLLSSSTGSIGNTNRSTIGVLLLADLSADGDIVIGDGAADLVNFGRLSLNALNASVIESSGTILSSLEIAQNLELFSANSIADDENAVLNVVGNAKFVVSGQPQSIFLDGANNRFGSLDLTSTDIDITLAGSTSLTSVLAGDVEIDAPTGTLSIASGASFQVDQRAELRAQNIRFDEGSINEVGSLSLITSVNESSSVEIRSNITPRLIDENPTNPSGVIEINSPNTHIGIDGGTVSLVTEGGIDGGSISISGVNEVGFPEAGSGVVHLSGEVLIDTTSNGDSSGNNVTMVSDGIDSGLIRAEDSATTASLQIKAGAGDIAVGKLDSSSRINSFTVIDGQNVELDDIFVAGNTVQIDALGDVHISGLVDDSEGDVNISTSGSIVADQPMTAAGGMSLQSTGKEVSVQDISADSEITIAAAQGMLLGGNTTASSGAVTLVSSAAIDSVGEITSGSDTQLIAEGNVTLGTGGGNSISAAANVSVTAEAGDLTMTGVTGSGDVTAISVSGTVSQSKDTVISAGGAAILSAHDGIGIATVDAANDVTLVITQSELETGEAAPTFSRVNDPISVADGGEKQDINSSGGAIVFLAPVADVGSAVVGQNLVQRADAGIFYGLDEGQFYSDDIGGSIILTTIPENTMDDLAVATVSSAETSSNLTLDFDSPIALFDIAAFSENLSGASSAEASAGETAASSSSRSTAASQQDDEEEVAEVDEVAFQNLKNYDENPQGILLPEDQSFAYDDDGNIYFIVSLSHDGYYGQKETFSLYRVDLDLKSTVNGLAEKAEEDGKDKEELANSGQAPFTFEPSFLKLSMTGSAADIGGDE
ncbi:MAG: hypothetical protein CMQ20_10480 [Gammaproteobacteria bacterium]|nr:hypothetical protein [Gammaproteobacteria bacterium]